MPKYLIDANLPYYFSLWNTPDFIQQKDIGDTWNDDEIWNYARQHNLIIITKDADFSLKVLYRGTPPKVIHIKFGNLKIRDFHNTILTMWNIIERTIEESNLINVYIDKIEYIK